MNKIDWAAKLSSRKFWLAVALFVVSVLAIFKVDGGLVEQISGSIGAFGAVIVYVLAEGKVDEAKAKNGQ
jgi:hypothetical protein